MTALRLFALGKVLVTGIVARLGTIQIAANGVASSLRAAGDVKFTMYAGIASMVVFRLGRVGRYGRGPAGLVRGLHRLLPHPEVDGVPGDIKPAAAPPPLS